MDYDKTKMPASYDAGRGYSPSTLALWLSVIARAAPAEIHRILDLGCGTGRFSKPLAEHFGVDVLAIDPSEAMLGEARRKTHPRLTYERASGEALPAADGGIDLVFMSMVFHHFKDRDRVVAECWRVLRPGGRVALRAGVAEETASYGYVPFFPETVPIIQKTLQTKAGIDATFAHAGFRAVRHEIVQSPLAANWTEFAERIAHRADSILIQIDDDAFASGLAALRRHAATAPPDVPLSEPVDFFVYEKPGAN